MARRTRRSSDHDGDASLGLLLLIIGTSVYRWITGLTLPWIVALSTLTITMVILGGRAIVLRRRRLRRERFLRDNLYALGDRAFEEAVGLILQDLGWQQVHRHGGRGDRGVDLRGTCNDMQCIVQCKRYKDRVGPEKVRELVGTLQNQRADRAYLITTGRFTDQGYEEAYGHPIELWDGQMLAQQMQRAHAMQHDPVLVRRQRSRRRWVMGSLVLVNAVALCWALIAPAAPRDSQAAASVVPSVTPSTPGQVTPTPDVTATPSRIPALHATVSHGGNMRVASNLQSNVIDLVEVGEALPVLEQSADGTWYRVTTPRGITGWVHRSLLKLPSDAVTAVPVRKP